MSAHVGYDGKCESCGNASGIERRGGKVLCRGCNSDRWEPTGFADREGRDWPPGVEIRERHSGVVMYALFDDGEMVSEEHGPIDDEALISYADGYAEAKRRSPDAGETLWVGAAINPDMKMATLEAFRTMGQVEEWVAEARHKAGEAGVEAWVDAMLVEVRDDAP